VGFLENATYPGGVVINQAGRPVKTSVTSVAMVAAVQEFGSARVPSRPFFRRMIAEKQGEWGPAVGALLKANDYDALKTLDLAGQAIQGQLKASILDTNDPPLAESTIRQKGFDKPLIDTSVMYNSVDYEVSPQPVNDEA
jgi:hypothetical protein